MVNSIFKKFQKKLVKKWLDLELSPESTVEHIRIGTRYGGWNLPSTLKSTPSHSHPDRVAYCFGAGEDISFDLGLVQLGGWSVNTFDPTPRAIKHFENLKTNTQKGLPTEIDRVPGSYYSASPEDIAKLHFFGFGAWSSDTTLKFYEPKNPEHVSHSIVNLQKKDTFFSAPCKRIVSIMKELHHETIDLIKLDIEGAEYEVLKDLMLSQVKPPILCIEFDEGHTTQSFAAALRIIKTLRKLKRYGYKISYRAGWDITLILERKGTA